MRLPLLLSSVLKSLYQHQAPSRVDYDDEGDLFPDKAVRQLLPQCFVPLV